MLTIDREAKTTDEPAKHRRPVKETPLAQFVRARLGELGMKQAEFCRVTGFDQGLLSKIHSSMISKLNLETALRLAVGLSVPAGTILGLIGRLDLDALILSAYPQFQGLESTDKRIPEQSMEVVQVSRLVLEAQTKGHDLQPIVERLKALTYQEPDQVGQSGRDKRLTESSDDTEV